MNILGDVNISNNINFFLVISSFTILCLLAVIILKNFRSRLINPLRELVVNCVLTLILTMASILFCVALSQITTKQLVKDVGLTFGYYDVSMGLSFMCSVLLFGSCWYSFKCFKNKRHNEMPLNVSHSNTDLPNDIPT